MKFNQPLELPIIKTINSNLNKLAVSLGIINNIVQYLRDSAKKGVSPNPEARGAVIFDIHNIFQYLQLVYDVGVLKHHNIVSNIDKLPNYSNTTSKIINNHDMVVTKIE